MRNLLNLFLGDSAEALQHFTNAKPLATSKLGTHKAVHARNGSLESQREAGALSDTIDRLQQALENGDIMMAAGPGAASWRSPTKDS